MADQGRAPEAATSAAGAAVPQTAQAMYAAWIIGKTFYQRVSQEEREAGIQTANVIPDQGAAAAHAEATRMLRMPTAADPPEVVQALKMVALLALMDKVTIMERTNWPRRQRAHSRLFTPHN
jgi:hypothetical protein